MTIINKVAQSDLITLDLADFRPEGRRLSFDLSDWLEQGLILREKDFRACIKAHDWSFYEEAFVAVHCTTEAIVPVWAYLLITLSLRKYASYVVLGNLSLLEEIIFYEHIRNLELDVYRDKPIILKGCSPETIPDNAYLFLIQRLQPIVNRLMFGEACSTVPLYKNG